MKNEKTSKKVAKLAGKILNAFSENEKKQPLFVLTRDGDLWRTWIKVEDLQSLAASALTQVADKR